MLRFTLDEGSKPMLDPVGSAEGRGAWLCIDPRCLRQALKRGSFARSFRRRVNTAQAVPLEESIASALQSRLSAAQRTIIRYDDPALGRMAVQGALTRLTSWTAHTSDSTGTAGGSMG
jgi:predicted RNA-binding protein YlxR (DUF448 family)